MLYRPQHLVRKLFYKLNIYSFVKDGETLEHSEDLRKKSEAYQSREGYENISKIPLYFNTGND